jgi:hypothetical protein
MGPQRSSTPWHLDPGNTPEIPPTQFTDGTSAWNALISGRKRWALYPPHKFPPGTSFIRGKDGKLKFSTPFPFEWFTEIYPNLATPDRPWECTQLPGEIIFVPYGWWHCVINIEGIFRGNILFNGNRYCGSYPKFCE